MADSPIPQDELPSGWCEMPLNALAEIRFSSVDKKSMWGELPVRLCNYTDVYFNDYITADMEFMRATATRSEIARFALGSGDVVVTKDSETPDDIGVPTHIDSSAPDLLCGYHLALIRPSTRVDTTFLAKQLSQPRIRRYFGRLANGTTRYGLSAAAIEQAPIWLPSIDQQRRIGQIARLVDAAIETTVTVIAKLKQVRAGLLHDLVTEDLDQRLTRPLISAAAVRFSSVDKKSEFGEAPVRLCNYTDVYNNTYIDAAMSFMEATASQPEIDRFGLRAGDVVITKDSETPDDIGVPAVVDSTAPDIVCGYHLALIRPDLRALDPLFLAMQFSHSRLMRYFGQQANGSTRYGLSSRAIEQAPILDLPRDEQKRRSDVLREHDRAAAAVALELRKLRSIKAGLMEDLLSGRVPVPVPEGVEVPA